METEFKLHKKLDHIAIIMDGNGRWAQAHNKPRTYGHRVALSQLINIVEECSRLGIKACSLYAFSTENWKRPKDEVTKLFKYLIVFFKKYMDRLMTDNILVRTSGDISKLPPKTIEAINESIKKSSKNTGMSLNICLNYGGYDEIVRATKNIVSEVNEGKLKIEDIDQDVFADHLYTKGLPPVDLLIRTSGEMRTSNFLPWQLAYAEMVFPKTPFPDFNIEELHKAILEYENRGRRYGGLKNE